MLMAEARAEVPPDTYYSPARIGWWLKNWELLVSLAETPHSSVHLLMDECKDSPHACSNGRPVGIKATRSRSVDALRHADILADLRAAIGQLPPYSLESQVAARLTSGQARNLEQVCEQIQARDTRVYGAFRQVKVMLARSLGWEEPHENA